MPVSDTLFVAGATAFIFACIGVVWVTILWIESKL